MLEGPTAAATLDIDTISNKLRVHLADNPPGRAFDDQANLWLDTFLSAADKIERQLLPRRMQRALEQMSRITGRWAGDADARSDTATAERWRAMARFAAPSDTEAAPDPYLVAQRWLKLVAPVLDAERSSHRRARYIVLHDIDQRLTSESFDIADVETAMSGLPIAAPLAKRVSACILGVPDPLPQHPVPPMTSTRTTSRPSTSQ